MESITLIPSATSHITHSMASTLNEQGIQAHIFISKPLEEEYADVEPMSVYLITAGKSELFLPFHTIKDKALVLSLPVYIALLEYFHQHWPLFKLDLEKKFKLIRRKKNPYQLHASIHFYLSGTAYFERWFQDAFLFFKKCSTDFTTNMFHLQRASKTLDLDPEVMYALAQNYQGLLNILYQAGYNHVPEYEEIRS
jgi:hypothetical protein